MGTPTNDKLRTYLAGRYLTADDDALTSFEADAGGSTTTIVDAALTEANGYWDGAFGWFLGDTTTVALRGQEFHVKTFTAADDTLLTAKTLPAAPAAGDTYKLVQGGKWRSAQESFGLTAGGIQPELVTSTLTNITGVTLKRVSPKIGTSGFTVFYDQSEDELFVKIAAEAYGVALDVSGDLTDAIVFGEDAQSYIQIDVTNGSLPGTDQTDIFTSAYASRLFIPDFEGYETTPGPKIRHRLEVVKNEDASDPLIGLSVYVAPPAGTATTIAAAESVALIAGTCELTAATD